MAVRHVRLRRFGGLVVLAALGAAGLVATGPAGPAVAESVTLTPVEDTYVNQGAPSTGYGSSSSLASRGGLGAVSYLRFTLPQAPNGSVLTRAALRIKSTSDPAATSVDPHTVAITTAAWSEATTWNTRPAVTGPALGTVPPVGELNTVVTVDLEAAPLTSRLGTSVTLTVSTTGSDSLYFWSSNHVTGSYRPALLLTFGPAAEPTTTTSTATTTTTTATPTTATTTTPTTTATTTTTSTTGSGEPNAPGDLVATPPSLLAPAAAPRIAVLPQQAGSLPGAVRIAPDDARLTYRGASDFAYGTSYPDTLMYLPSSRYPHTWGSQTAFTVEFNTDAAVFEVFFKQRPTGMFRLAVDGRRTTALPQSTGATVNGGLYVLRFDFGSSAARRITLDLISVPFGGVDVPAGASLTKVTSAETRWVVLGDSISGGSLENAGYAHGTWVNRFALLTGWHDAFNESIGGTGFVNPGSSVVFGKRVDRDVIAHAPKHVVVWGGYNDLGSSQSSIASAAADVLARIKAGLPGATVYLVGCWSPTGSPGTSLRNTDATLRRVASEAGVAFVSPITGTVYDTAGQAVAELGPWITGTGNAAAPKGNGNADLYVGSDGVHPTDAGHSHLGMKLASAVAALTGGVRPGAGVGLSWSAPQAAAGRPVRYEVHRGAAAGFLPTTFTLVGTTTTTSFQAPGDEPGVFWYRVVAVDAAGTRSAPSAAVSAAVLDDTSYVTTQRVDVPAVVTLTPTADTYVNQSAPNTNYGTSSSLGARGNNGATAYLNFALPAPPAGKTLSSATLAIRTNNDPSGPSTDTFDVRLTTASWSETGMTWNNRPGINGPAIGTLRGATETETTYPVALTTGPLAAVAGTTTTVVVSAAGGTDSLYFWSRNYANAAGRPTLTLTYD